MITTAILAPIMLLAGAPAEAAQAAPAKATTTVCARHHLQVPPGKGLISTVMRCSDQPIEQVASTRDKQPAAQPAAIVSSAE
jgi:hypothetical protein